MKIGIPRALMYYHYFPLWKTFYQELNQEIVLSEETNKNILDLGVKNCVDEACLPVKVFHGHVESLKNEVDIIFIPRITSVSYGEFICPKFCGLPEMIINSIHSLPTILKPDFNFHDKKVNIKKTVNEMIGPLKVNYKEAQEAFYKGLNQMNVYKKNLYNGFYPNQALEWDFEKERKEKIINNKGALMVLAHPYHLYDPYINMDLLKKIEDMGYEVITTDMLEGEKINYYASLLPKRMFWTFGRELIGATVYALEEKLPIKGIVYLSSFACGIDSIVADYIERKIRRQGKIPFMQLTIDEHTGEAGLDTRLEAFVEMIQRRRDHFDRGFSPYGQCIHRS